MLKVAYQIGVELAFKEAGLDPKLAGILSSIGKGFGKLLGQGAKKAKPGGFKAFQQKASTKKMLGQSATETSAYRKAMRGTPAGGRKRLAAQPT